MAVKDDAKTWTILEQIIEDPVSGLSIQFEVAPDGEPRLRLFGNVPHGNREFQFNVEGKEAGAGTFLAGLCKPTWFMSVDD